MDTLFIYLFIYLILYAGLEISFHKLRWYVTGKGARMDKS